MSDQFCDYRSEHVVTFLSPQDGVDTDDTHELAIQTQNVVA